MVIGRVSQSSRVAVGVIVLSAALVFTRIGWYAALNAGIPFVIALLWLSVLALSAWGAGDLALRRCFKLDQAVFEDWVLRLLGGTALLMVVAGLLGVMRLLHPTTLLVVLGASCCHGALRIYRRPPRLTDQIFPPRDWAWLAILIGGGISLAAATTFAPFYDQWHYHLGFPYQWLRSGSIVTFPRQAYSFFPSDMGLLYLYGLAGPGGWAAQVTHWWMGGLAAAGSASIADRLGAPTAGRVLAAAVFVATPSVVQLGALAASDLGVAAFATGAVIGLIRLQNDREHAARWAVMSGALAGFAAGAKYLALATVTAPVAIAVLIISWSNTPNDAPRARHVVRVVLAFAIAGTATVGPWLVRNALQTGNPVYPYFSDIFNLQIDESVRADARVASGIGTFAVSPQTAATALTLGTFSRRGHAGDIGPVYLWLMPLIVIWMLRRRRDGDALLIFGLMVVGIAVWASGPPLGRYLLPSLTLAAALIGTAWSEIVGTSTIALRRGLDIFLLLVLVANCNPVRGEYLGDQMSCFLGYRSDAEYLQANSTQLDAIRTVNQQLPADARVLLVGEPRAYGIDRDIVVEDPFRKPLLVELAETAASPREIRDHLLGLGITHLVWNAAEAARIAAADGRGDYLACSSVEARSRLDRFLADHITPVASGRSWEIGALDAD